LPGRKDFAATKCLIVETLMEHYRKFETSEHSVVKFEQFFTTMPTGPLKTQLNFGGVHSILLVPIWRFSTWQKHFLHEVVALPANRLIFCNCKIGEDGVMPDIGCIAVSLDIHCPFKAVDICMASAHIFGL
jgi:hypothetical protein